MVLWTSIASSLALNPDLPPGENFDLSLWKLTLPDAIASEIWPVQLEAGFTNMYFYTGSDGAMTFWCPVTGGVTGGTIFPRSELRELMDPNNENLNWSGFGTNILEAQCRVTKVPSTKTVIIGQIHSFTGNAFPLVKLQYRDGRMEALVKESPNDDEDRTFAFANVSLGASIEYRLALTDGLLTMSVNGSNRTFNVFESDSAWSNQTFFFRAGAYCQDDSGLATEGATVAFYELSVAHSLRANARPSITITNGAGTLTGTMLVTLVGQEPGNYFIQSSTNFIQWDYVLITNSASGRIVFAHTRAPGCHYYRGGVFSAITLVNRRLSSSGQFSFTMIGPGAGNYFIQSSSDLSQWNFILITNSTTGWINFSEEMSPGARFYRGGGF